MRIKEQVRNLKVAHQSVKSKAGVRDRDVCN